MAKDEQKQIELYQADLIWLLANRNYDLPPQPSQLYYRRKKTDTRSGKQIVEDLIKNLGGE